MYVIFCDSQIALYMHVLQGASTNSALLNQATRHMIFQSQYYKIGPNRTCKASKICFMSTNQRLDFKHYNKTVMVQAATCLLGD